MTRDVSFYLKQAHSRVNAGGLQDAEMHVAQAWARPTRLGVWLGGKECLAFGKFVQDAEAAQQDWGLVEYFGHSKGGFSGTMLRALRSDPARGVREGDVILVFHFVESGAKQPKRTRWTAGQVADMETWFSSLNFSGLSPANARYGVIGYSEGDHVVLTSNLRYPQVGMSRVRTATRPIATNTISYVNESEAALSVPASRLLALEPLAETQ